MQLIHLPTDQSFLNENSIMLCGGIERNWRAKVINGIQSLNNITIVNPETTNVKYQKDKLSHICDEYRCIRRVSQLLFWFSDKSPCSMTLFELASALERQRVTYYRPQKIFIGCHEKYILREDVRYQVRCINADINIWDSLDELITAVIAYNAH